MGFYESETSPLCAQTSLGEGLITAGAQLVELDLSDNAFGPDGVRGFEALLKSSACFTLHELKLNNCGMGIGGGKVGVAGSRTSLLSLTLLPFLPRLLLRLHPLEMRALGHHLGRLGCGFSLQRRKASTAAACGQWGEEVEAWRVGLPSNGSPVLSVVLATQRQCRIQARPAASAERRAWTSRLAVSPEQLAEPREAECVPVGEGAQKERLLGPGHSSPSASTGPPPSSQSGRLVSTERHLFSPQNLYRGSPASFSSGHSGSFRPRYQKGQFPLLTF